VKGFRLAVITRASVSAEMKDTHTSISENKYEQNKTELLKQERNYLPTFLTQMNHDGEVQIHGVQLDCRAGCQVACTAT